MAGDNGEPLMAMYDLTAGKYDLTVKAGPNFTTRREEAAVQMTELIRAFPQAAPLVADILARNLDWPEADKVAERFKSLVPPGAQEGLPPQIVQMIEQGKQQIAQLSQEVEKLKQDSANKSRELDIKAFDAETDRMKVAADAMKPPPPVRAPQRANV
jgi:hypothetical protein